MWRHNVSLRLSLIHLHVILSIESLKLKRCSAIVLLCRVTWYTFPSRPICAMVLSENSKHETLLRSIPIPSDIHKRERLDTFFMFIHRFKSYIMHFTLERFKDSILVKRSWLTFKRKKLCSSVQSKLILRFLTLSLESIHISEQTKGVATATFIPNGFSFFVFSSCASNEHSRDVVSSVIIAVVLRERSKNKVDYWRHD